MDERLRAMARQGSQRLQMLARRERECGLRGTRRQRREARRIFWTNMSYRLSGVWAEEWERWLDAELRQELPFPPPDPRGRGAMSQSDDHRYAYLAHLLGRPV